MDNPEIIPEKETKPLWGIWIPGKGWLRANSEHVAFETRDVAVSVAARVGEKARAEFIDSSLAALEKTLLESERKKLENRLWERLKNRLKRLKDFLSGKDLNNGVS